MRILLLTQWFEPESTFKGLPFAKELARRGHEVEVLTGFPNYPGGRIYPGYRLALWKREQIAGISVVRVALYPSHNKSALLRILNYVSFALTASLLGPFLVRQPDVIYVYHPPVTIGLAATVIGLLRRVPFVYDIQDLWPDTVAVSGMMSSPVALTALAMWCKFVYRRAGHIVVLSPGFKRELVRRGVPPKKIDVIYNWCDEGSGASECLDRGLMHDVGEFTVLFAGTMGVAQGLDAVLYAAEICRSTVPKARFKFIGWGVDRERLERKAAGLGLDNVSFMPPVPANRMGQIFAAADVLLVYLKDDPLFRITIPSKTQAYFAAGKPVLMGALGDSAQLVRDARAGVVVAPDDVAALADAVRQLSSLTSEQRDEMGQSGRRYYDANLCLRVGVDRFERVFQSLLRCSGVEPAKS